MGRIFSVRINLDLMSAQLETCDTDAEKAQWLSGFQVGSRGGSARDGWTMPKVAGHSLGLAAYKEAAAYAVKMSESGAKSAAARRAKFGSAQPPEIEGGSKVVRTLVRETSNLTSNRVIQESSERGNEESSSVRTTPPPIDFFKGMDEDETAVEIAQPVVDEINWQDWRLHHGQVFVGGRDSDGSPKDWERLFDFYGVECMDEMYRRILKAAPGKVIYFNQAVTFLEKNTRKPVNVQAP